MNKTRQRTANRLGQAVQDARAAKGLTQQELAGKAGCHLTAINHIERGRRMPRIELLFSIAEALDVTVDSLMG
jgi:HTH-type transcriptional regulator/antitoxin HipB